MRNFQISPFLLLLKRFLSNLKFLDLLISVFCEERRGDSILTRLIICIVVFRRVYTVRTRTPARMRHVVD